VKIERIPWREKAAPGESALREKLEAEGFDVVVWRDRSNWSYEPHAHEHDESLWVLDGNLVLRIEDRDFPLGPGDRMMLPKEVVHDASVGPDGARYLIGAKR
jgi:mannose-6-phosphate isomerase-like protein (cupin superfamily)